MAKKAKSKGGKYFLLSLMLIAGLVLLFMSPKIAFNQVKINDADGSGYSLDEDEVRQQTTNLEIIGSTFTIIASIGLMLARKND